MKNLKFHRLVFGMPAGFVILVLSLGLSLDLISSCSSKPTSSAPPWSHQPARTVDNGYIVYIGAGEDPSPERAQFKAEGVALQDLANECSFAPKGTRIEDRFSEQLGYQYHAYAKVAVEIQECDDAKKALDPEAIKVLANEPFAQEVKKYQDLVDEEAPEAIAEGSPVPGVNPPPVAGATTGGSVVVVHDNFGFFVARQQVAYYKEVVILSPPGTYPPQAPQTVALVRNMSEPAQQIQNYEHENPSVRTAPTTWSSLPNKPASATLKPASLKAMAPPRAPRPQAIKPPSQNSRRNQGQNKGANGSGQKPGGRRHRRGWSEPGNTN